MEEYDKLTNSQIRISPGPITDSTRRLYIKKLKGIESKGYPSSTKGYSSSTKGYSSSTKVTPILQRKLYSPSRSPIKVNYATEAKEELTNDNINCTNENINSTNDEDLNTTPIKYTIYEKCNKQNITPNISSLPNTPLSYSSINKPESTDNVKLDHIEVNNIPKRRLNLSWLLIIPSFIISLFSKIISKSSNSMVRNELDGNTQESKSSFFKYFLYFVVIPLGFGIIYPFIFYLFTFLDNSRNIIYFLSLISGLIGAVFLLRYLYKRHKINKLRNTRMKYVLIDKVLDLVHEQRKKYSKNKTSSPFITVQHARDMLIPPAERQSNKLRVWNDVVNFIKNNESRIKTEVQRLSGQECDVWKWVEESPRESKYDCKKALNSIQIDDERVTSCLKIYVTFENNKSKNMSDVVSSVDKVLTIFGFKDYKYNLIPSEFLIYIKFISKDQAFEVANKLNKTKVSDGLLNIKFIPEHRYDQRFERS